MKVEFYNGLLLLISILLLTIGTVSILKYKVKKSNKFLGLFFLILGSSMLFRFIEATRLINSLPHLIELDFPFCFLVPPCYFLFVKGYLLDYKPTIKEQFLYSVPAILVFIFLLPVFSLNTTEKLDYILNEANSSFSWRYQILNTSFFISTTIYLFLSINVSKKNHVLGLEFNQKAKWLSVLSYTILFIHIITLLFILLIKGDKKFEHSPLLALLIIIVVLIWLLQKSDLLNTYKKLEDDTIKTKYKNSTLSNEDLTSFSQKIILEINTNQLFLNKNISLSDLADRLNISSRTISEVINRQFSCSFNDLINKLRIEYSKTLLITNIQTSKIDVIAEDAGFNSRASFYTNFKKITGTTPSDFIKNHSAD